MADRDAIAKYDKTAESYAASLAPKADTEQLERFFELTRPGVRVLDVGCAAGRDTKLIADAGFDVVGVDLSEQLLKIAREKYPDLKFVLADLAELPFPDASCDGIWASAVLHHFELNEMPGALQELVRVLRPNGVIYVHTKLGEGTLTAKDALIKGEERNFTLLTQPALEALLQATGLKKIESDTRESKSRPGLFWVSAYYRKP